MTEIERVISDLAHGEFVVPEIQRPFVWPGSKVKDLVESIFLRFPIGAIVVWRMPKSFAAAHPQILSPLADDLPVENGSYMVIDGRQRLTSLLLLSRGALQIGGESEELNLFFNASRRIFETGDPEQYKYEPDWFSVTELLSLEAPELIGRKRAAGVQPDPATESAILPNLNRLRMSILGYNLTFLDTFFENPENFDELLGRMSRMFVRLNSKGTRIRMPDLVLALLTGIVRGQIDVSFREKFDEVGDETERMGFDLEDAALVRAFTSISVEKTKFSEASEPFERMGAPLILENLEKTKKALVSLVKLFQEKIGVKSDEYLYSRYYVVPLAYALHRDFLSRNRAIAEEDLTKIRHWLVGAAATGRYTGELERLLAEDIRVLREGLGWDGLIANLDTPLIKEGDVTTTPDSRYRTLLSLLYQANRAPDWLDPSRAAAATVSTISELAATDIEVHHIFPKKFLRTVGIRDKRTEHAGNLTLISADANEQVGMADPADYLQELVQRNADSLRLHFIPADTELWFWKNFDRFLSERSKLIIGAVQDTLGIRVVRPRRRSGAS